MKSFGTEEIVFLAAKRTAFGTFGGALKKLSATDLGVVAARGAIAQSGVKPSQIDSVIFGNVQQTSADAIYLARHIGLKCEIPEKVPALTVNRLCGSGFQSIINGAQELLLGESKCVLVGGTESMSQAPHVVRGARFGLPFGKPNELEDSLWSSLTDSYTGLPMAMTAENLADEYKISQDEVDAYSVRSQKLHAEAQAKGYYDDEIVSVELKSRKGTTLFNKDEHGRETTVEGLKKLPKIFKKDGVIHAGAASGICDGAGALVMCTRTFADENNLKPIGRLVNWGVSGCDPKIMGIGPVPATKIALERAEASLSDMDLIEVNEAFAPQALACAKALDIPEEKFNVDGGAIAMGHPLAASGARITTHLLYALKQRGKKVGLGSACIGGGQGIALIVEAL